MSERLNRIYKYICTNCGDVVTKEEFKNNKKDPKGYGCVAWILASILFLFLTLITGGYGLIILIPIFIVLIIVDHIKAYSNMKSYCPKCNTENSYVSIDTPVGKELYDKYYPQDDNTDNA